GRRPHGARRSARSAPGLLPGAEVVGEEPRSPAARPPRGEAPPAADPGAGGAVDGMVPARAPRGSLPGAHPGSAGAFRDRQERTTRRLGPPRAALPARGLRDRLPRSAGGRDAGP